MSANITGKDCISPLSANFLFSFAPPKTSVMSPINSSHFFVITNSMKYINEGFHVTHDLELVQAQST